MMDELDQMFEPPVEKHEVKEYVKISLSLSFNSLSQGLKHSNVLQRDQLVNNL
jgi:hypothetical protein